MAAIEEVLLAYAAAWSETDEGKRRTLLEKGWAENGIYTDPIGEVSGREALVQHIGRFLQQFPGHRILLTSGIDEHHRRIRDRRSGRAFTRLPARPLPERRDQWVGAGRSGILRLCRRRDGGRTCTQQFR